MHPLTPGTIHDEPDIIHSESDHKKWNIDNKIS